MLTKDIEKNTNLGEDVNFYVGQQIKKFRKEAHLSQSELSKLLGYSFTEISKMENGKKTITVDILAQAAEIFNRDYKDFFPKSKNISTNNRSITIVYPDSFDLQEIHDIKKYLIKTHTECKIF